MTTAKKEIFIKHSTHNNEEIHEIMTTNKKEAHTAAFVESQEKYVVKKHGSFPSVTLYNGTFRGNPSRDAAISMCFCKELPK